MDSPSGTDTKACPQKTLPTYTSPYSKIVALRFADQVLHVHQFQLRNIHDLRIAAAKHDTIDLSEFSGVAGHILINYLYSGAYETLIDAKDNVSALDTLRVNFEVYSLAIGHELPGLRDMAQAAIENQSDDLDPPQALAFIKKACPLVGPEESWLRTLTKSLLRRTYSDVASFLKSDLMAPNDAEINMSITEMLLRSVISLATEKEEQQAREREAREAREKLNRDREEALRVEQEAQEAEPDRLKALCAERDELGKKKYKKGKLLKKDSVRLAIINDEIVGMMAGSEEEPQADGDEQWLKARIEPELEPELLAAVDLAEAKTPSDNEFWNSFCSGTAAANTKTKFTWP